MVKKISKNFTYILISLLVVLVVILVFSQPTQAPSLDINSAKDNIKNPTENTFITLTSSTNIGQGVVAESYLIYDDNSKENIASKNQDTAVAIASLTKLMTAYTVEKYGNLNDTWAITKDSVVDIKPLLGLAIGDQVLVSDLLKGMLIGSANDAAKSLGEYLSVITKQPAVTLMNKEAADLGMMDTHYENPIGFDSEQNYSTAANLKILVEKVRTLPVFSEIDRKQSYSFTNDAGKSYAVKATNTLLARDTEIHAIKTGYTDEAKGAMITAVYHNNKKFIIIVLGSSKREEDTLLLKEQVISALKE